MTRCSNSKTPGWHTVCYNCVADAEHASHKFVTAWKRTSIRKQSALNDGRLCFVMKAQLTIGAQNLRREGDAEKRVVGEEKDDNQQYGGDLPRVNRAEGACTPAQL